MEKIKRYDKEYGRFMEIDIIFDLFKRGCRFPRNDGILYDHSYIPIFQEIQEFLISVGKIKPEECYRK